MTTWHSVDLGDGAEAFDPTSQIQKAFMTAYTSNNGQTSGMAAFSRYDLQTNIVTVYFTPNAGMIAQIFKATPCEKPTVERLSLTVGDANSWQDFFPGETPGGRRS